VDKNNSRGGRGDEEQAENAEKKSGVFLIALRTLRSSLCELCVKKNPAKNVESNIIKARYFTK